MSIGDNQSCMRSPMQKVVDFVCGVPYITSMPKHISAASKAHERGNQHSQDGPCEGMRRRRYHWPQAPSIKENDMAAGGNSKKHGRAKRTPSNVSYTAQDRCAKNKRRNIAKAAAFAAKCLTKKMVVKRGTARYKARHNAEYL